MLTAAPDVVNDKAEQPQLGSLIEQPQETMGARVEVTLADAGYHFGSSIEECARKGHRREDCERNARTRRRCRHFPSLGRPNASHKGGRSTLHRPQPPCSPWQRHSSSSGGFGAYFGDRFRALLLYDEMIRAYEGETARS